MMGVKSPSFTVRVSRNLTSHFYSVDFAEQTLSLISDFLPLARELLQSLEERSGY